MRRIMLLMVLVVIFSGCAVNKVSVDDVNGNEEEQNTNENEKEKEETKDTPVEEVNNDDVIEMTLEDRLEAMSLEDKIAQLFILEMTSLNEGKGVVQMNERIEETLTLYPVGGVIFFQDNIIDVNQTVDLIQGLQKDRQIPLFISVDEEGGLVSRIGKNPNMNATVIPNMSVVGKTENEEYAYEIGKILGRELKSLGFNLNFAPVADVNTNPKNPIIGTRAFGSDPLLVAKMVEKLVEGMQKEGVGAVLKHFPGHGDTSTDSHLGTVYVEHRLDRLREVEWIPFSAGINAGAFGVMSAHIQLPNVLEEEVPSTLSKEMMTIYLRDELGFDGLIITDALNMGAISKNYTMAEAAVKVLEAGCDILLMPIPFIEAYDAVIQAVVEGRLSEERIDQSVLRILDVKEKLGMFESNDEATSVPEEVLGAVEHRTIVEEIKAKGR